jgi:hypothetical protein
VGPFWGDCDRLRSRICGLCRARLAFVGDAKEGRLCRVVVACSSGDAVAPISREVRGEVRRRFGADSSMARFDVVIRLCSRVTYDIVVILVQLSVVSN